MTLLEAIVLGIVQGLTEWLPISSTAHLRLVPALLGWSDPGAAFTAVIQIGTLAAVLVYFRADIVRILRAVFAGLVRGKPIDSPDARLGWMIALGTVPVVIFGLAFESWIDRELRSLHVIAGALIVLALVLAVAEWLVCRVKDACGRRALADLGWGDAAVVGLAQALALIPGSSRSGVTLTAGLFLGMTRETAARFSFLLSLPAVFAAGIYKLLKHRHELLGSQEMALNLAVATIISGIVGYASIALLLRYLRTRTTLVFIVYRLVLGAAVLVLLARGIVAAA